MALRLEGLCQVSTEVINHVCDGSHSVATLLFTGTNEASAVPSAESECCCGEEEVRSLSKGGKGSHHLPQGRTTAKKSLR